MTTKAITRATAHFKKLAAEPLEIRVPEWDSEGELFTIYATPITLTERARLERISPNNFELAANILILKAKDEQGNALFTKDDKDDLMRRVSSQIIRRIANQIVDDGDLSEEAVEEHEKN